MREEGVEVVGGDVGVDGGEEGGRTKGFGEELEGDLSWIRVGRWGGRQRRRGGVRHGGQERGGAEEKAGCRGTVLVAVG